MISKRDARQGNSESQGKITVKTKKDITWIWSYIRNITWRHCLYIRSLNSISLGAQSLIFLYVEYVQSSKLDTLEVVLHIMCSIIVSVDFGIIKC